MDNVMLLATMAGILLVLGAFAGVLAGLLGVGGGIILVPAFFYVFSVLGYDSPQLMQICLGTSLATIIVTSLRSVLAHNKKGAVDWKILKTWIVGIAIGAALGVAVASTLRSDVLQAIFGGLAICVGLYMAFGSAEWRIGSQMPRGVLHGIISPILGFLSVLMGIGGGSFGVPTMTLFGVPIHRAVATAAGFGVIIAVPSVIGFLFVDIEVAPPFTVGAVNFLAFGLIVLMTLITAPWGAALAHRMNPGPLKRLFGVFLILVALNMIRKALGW
jgi:uncharacterized membrane protein YfcA